MWFGTEDGLNKYDGYTFRVYRHDPQDSNSVSYNYIRVLFEDRRGNLWIGTMGGGLCQYNRKKDNFIRYSIPDPDSTNLGFKYVHTIIEDHFGRLWIGFDTGGLLCIDTDQDTLHHYKSNPARFPMGLSYDDVWCLLEDSRKRIWVGTLGGGLDRIDTRDGSIRHFQHSPKNPRSVSNNEIRSLYQDRNKNIWVGTNTGGLDLYDEKTDGFIHFRHDRRNPFSIGDNNIFSLTEDGEGNFWVGTENGGLNLMNRKTGTFTRFANDIFDENSLSHNSVESLYADSLGIVWAGTYNGGVNYFFRNGDKFKLYKQTRNPASLSNNAVLSFLEERDGTLWIGTDGGGLNRFDSKTNSFQHFQHNPDDPLSISGNEILSLYIDRRNNFWAGTYTGGLNLFDRKTGRFTRFQHDPNNSSSLSNNQVSFIYEDRKGNLWIGTEIGLNTLDRQKGSFTHYVQDAADKNSISYDNVICVYEDRQNRLWFGTYGGGLNLYNPSKRGFTHFRHDEENDSSLSNNYVFTMLEDSRGLFWIGTGEGLNVMNPKTMRFKSYRQKDGLPNDFICGILEDHSGNLWISTHNGLSKFNPVTMKFRNYDILDGLQSNDFHYTTCLKRSTGEMLFGGVGGFNLFHPDSIRDNPHVPPIVICDLKIFNKPVRLGEKNAPITNHISEIQEMILSHRHSVFTLEYASLNYVLSVKNQFAYRLDPFDPDWNYVGAQRTATYTNLDPGDYIFRVKGSNNDGIWNETGASLKIKITPPFVKTIWFKIISVLLLGSLIFAVYYFRTTDMMKRNARLEMMNVQLNQQISERKKAEKALKKSEERFRSLYKNSRIGIYRTSPEGNIVMANPALVRLLGYEKLKDLAKRNFKEFGFDHLYSRAEYNTLMKRDGEIKGLESKWKLKNGKTIFVRESAKAFKDRYGNEQYYEGTVEDITERKKVEDRIRRLNEELEERVRQRTSQLEATNKELEAFAYSVSHDLRSPLRSINGFSQAIIEDLGDQLSEKNKDFFDRICAASHRMGMLIDDLLKLSRLTRSEMHFQKVNLSEIVESILNQIRETNPDRTVHCQVQKNIIVKGDASLLRVMLQNLLDNAWKFTRNCRNAVIEFGQTRQKQKSVYFIKDNGVGFDMAYSNKLFGEFQRLHSVSEFEGTGIGLATVRRVIHRHGGEVWGHSEKGKGAVFYFTLGS